METEHMGGSELTVPAHATVMILYSSSVAPQETMTTGVGLSMLPPRSVLLRILAIICRDLLRCS